MSTAPIPDTSRQPLRKVPFPTLKEGRAFDLQMMQMLRGRIEELSIVPAENTESYAHGEGFVFQRSDSSLGSGNFEPRFVAEEIETEAIVSNDLQALLRFIESSARGLVSQMHQLLF
jgi:hypothetical protein